MADGQQELQNGAPGEDGDLRGDGVDGVDEDGPGDADADDQ
jgi:hypothetical protein